MDITKVIKERFKCKLNFADVQKRISDNIIGAYDLSQMNDGDVKDVQIKFVFDNGNCVRSKLTQTFDNESCGAKMTIFVPYKFRNDVLKWCESNGLTRIPNELHTYYIEL